MTGALITLKFSWVPAAAALLLVVQSLQAGSDSAKQTPEPSTAAAKPEAVMKAGAGEVRPPPVAEVAPISVPVSDAVQAAALLMRPSGATLDQVVAAMVLMNPSVFTHGDLQHVTFSSPLNVPSTQDILREDPDGLVLLLQQFDVVAEVSLPPESDDSASSPRMADKLQGDAPIVDNSVRAGTTLPPTPAAEAALISSSPVLIAVSVTLLLISLMWVLFLSGRNRGRRPLPASSDAQSLEDSSAVEIMQGDQRHEDAWEIINQDAAEPGLKLDSERGTVKLEKRIERLKARVKEAENATRAAEQRAARAEQRHKEMQLQFDFGETNNDS